jgi:hypothetical protein
MLITPEVVKRKTNIPRNPWVNFSALFRFVPVKGVFARIFGTFFAVDQMVRRQQPTAHLAGGEPTLPARRSGGIKD